MKKRRLVKAAAVGVTLSLALAACGGDGDDKSGPAETIDIWVGFSDEVRLGFVEDKAAAFMKKHPDLDVKVQGFDDYEILYDAMKKALEGGEAPEVVHYFEAGTREALDSVDADGEPVYQSVEKAVDGRDEILDEPVVLDDVIPTVRDYYSVDGDFYSMPWNTSSLIMYGNDKLMKSAGIKEMPETWQDLEAACAKILKAPNAPKNCITWPNYGWWVEQTMGQMGALLGNNENGRDGRATEVDLDSEEMVKYISWWQEMKQSGNYVYTGKQADWDGVLAAFGAQKVAFAMSSSGDATGMQTTAKQNGYGVLAGRMPYDADSDYEGNLIGGGTLWLRAGLNAKTTDGALAFLQFFNNTDNAAEWHKVSGYVPITESATKKLEDEGWFDKNPNYKVASEQLSLSSGTPAATGVLMGSWVAIRDVVTEAIEDVLVNDVDPADRFKEADEEAQKLLDDYEALNAPQ